MRHAKASSVATALAATVLFSAGAEFRNAQDRSVESEQSSSRDWRAAARSGVGPLPAGLRNSSRVSRSRRGRHLCPAGSQRPQGRGGPRLSALRMGHLFIGALVEDLVTGRATNPDPEQRSDRIYTGFAMRRGVFDAVSQAQRPEPRRDACSRRPPGSMGHRNSRRGRTTAPACASWRSRATAIPLSIGPGLPPPSGAPRVG